MSWSPESSGAPAVVVAYSPQDEQLKDELGKHLSILGYQGAIRDWRAYPVAHGQGADASSEDPLAEADLVLLLISPDFLACAFCYGPEIYRAVQRHEACEACVVPVLGRPIQWRATPFGSLSPLPADEKSVTQWSNRDEAFAGISKGLREMLRERSHVQRKVASGVQKDAAAGRGADAAEPVTLPPQTVSHEAAPPERATPKAASPRVQQRARSTLHRVFVSSTYEDLKEHRAQVIDSLRKSGLIVTGMEDWTASPDEPQQFSQDRVEGCDLFVLLVAFRRGFVPDGAQLSITQMEYQAALNLGIDVLVYLLDDDSMWRAKFDEREKDPGIVQWREELGKKYGVEFFTHDPATLRVEQAVAVWLATRAAQGHASRATDCIENLADLLQRDPNVRDEAVKFQADFETISHQSKVLGDHKDLHDALHDLQVHSYNVIVDAAAYFPDDRSREHISRYESELRVLLDRMDEVARRDSFHPRHVSWMSNLRSAREALMDAVDGPSEEKLQEAIGAMRDVLAIQPSKVDTRLNMLASQFRLRDLVQAMKSICERVSTLGIESDKQQHFEAGARELEALDARLQQLVEAHYGWQAADDDLRRIEESLHRDLHELISSWPGLKAEMEPLYGALIPSQAEEFRSDAAKLDDAIQAQDAFKMRQYFRRYRAHATERFYETDQRLRDLCDELRGVAAPLDSILVILR